MVTFQDLIRKAEGKATDAADWRTDRELDRNEELVAEWAEQEDLLARVDYDVVTAIEDSRDKGLDLYIGFGAEEYAGPVTVSFPGTSKKAYALCVSTYDSGLREQVQVDAYLCFAFQQFYVDDGWDVGEPVYFTGVVDPDGVPIDTEIGFRLYC